MDYAPGGAEPFICRYVDEDSVFPDSLRRSAGRNSEACFNETSDGSKQIAFVMRVVIVSPAHICLPNAFTDHAPDRSLLRRAGVRAAYEFLATL